MTTAGFEVITKPTYRDIQGRFTNAEKGIREDSRDIMRTLGRNFVEIARDESPKKSGDYAKGFRFRTFSAGASPGFRFFSAQPLTTWITEGTKPHRIVPKGSGYPLRFFWEKVGRVVHLMSVNHPGTRPNPFLDRTYTRWIPKARIQLRRIATNWSDTIRGKRR